MLRTIAAAGMIAFMATADVARAGDAAQGKKKAGMCAACHGRDGNSINGLWPKLAGQPQLYLIKALKDFRAGARKDPSMNAMAKPLSDEDIANLAAFYASQKQK